MKKALCSGEEGTEGGGREGLRLFKKKKERRGEKGRNSLRGVPKVRQRVRKSKSEKEKVSKRGSSKGELGKGGLCFGIEK